jgi:ribosomal-protein-alanine N-acetyltransferase
MTGCAAPPCRIHAAEPAHAAAIVAIHRDLFDPAWDLESVRLLLELPTVRGFIAETGTTQAIAGFVLGQIAADEAELLSIGVARAWQRRGIGGLLTQELAASAARSGAKRLFLEVAIDNAPALALYRCQGFHPVGRREGYYERARARDTDALVLAKTL